jgi:TetR/AcrR family transcriptional repressor of nem operon
MRTTTRADAAARTRAALVEAGLRLADSGGLTGLSANRVVAEAGVAKGTFFHHFGDRAGYVVELHRSFHDRIAGEVRERTTPLPRGGERLLAATTTYLEACVRLRGVRALLCEARSEPAVLEEIERRDAVSATFLVNDFRALGRTHPLECARLWVGMTREAAVIEFDAGHAVTEVRAALAGYAGLAEERSGS